MKHLFIIIAASMFFTSCKSTKNIQKTIIPSDTTEVIVTPVDLPKEDSAATIKNNFKQIQNNFIKVSTFSAKVDVKYKDPEGKKYDVNANIRMYYDSVIWISVTGALGIEGLRAYITHDSVKIIDKQNKTYTARSVSYLQEVTELPLDLISLQDLLLGNPIFLDSNINSFSRSSENINLLCYGEFFKNLFSINEESKQTVSSKLDDVVDSRNRTCFLTYSGYELKKGISFSVNRSINVTEKKNLDIELEFKQYNFNETLSFPFNVSKNYKRN